MKKAEYAPLLGAGIHQKSLDDIKKICVCSFCNNSRRMLIYNKFCEFLSKLEQFNIQIEVWIDGSFVTKKEEPDDIDVVLFAKESDVNMLSVDKRIWLVSALEEKENCKTLYLTDAYFVPKEDDTMRSYWRGWFGFTREEKSKGIIKLEVNP